MEYRVRIGEQELPVEASPLDESGRCSMSLDGAQHTIVVRAISPHHLCLDIKGRTKNLFVARSNEGTWIWIDGHARLVKDAATEQRRKAKVRGETSREVTPPTPAGVVRVMAQVGDRVAKGKGLVVVSAMKMEMTLTAPYSGTVRSVNVAVGEQVSPGQILVEIEPDPEGEEDE